MAKVLVIDDSRLSVSALQNMLSGMGHDVNTSFSGEEGVEKAQSINPDVVCLDFVMPGIDGKDTAIKLKANNPDADIIMITQNPLDASVKNEIKARAYIVKPITKSKLEQAFSKL